MSRMKDLPMEKYMGKGPMSRVQFFRHNKPEDTFDPEAHRFLARAEDGTFIFPMKESDRWTSPPSLEKFTPVLVDDVPLPVFLKTASRLGAKIRWQS